MPLPSSSLSRTKAIDKGDEVGSARPNLKKRAASEGKILKPTSRVAELPKTKLTFVKGQFVDMSTEEGRAFAEMFAAKKEDDDGSLSDVSVRGVVVSLFYYLRIVPSPLYHEDTYLVFYVRLIHQATVG